jgi:Rad3-related DNA helicase
MGDSDSDGGEGSAFLTPREAGLPAKFERWRENQSEALEQVMIDLEEKRFVAYNIPVGGGKSPWYVALAKTMGWRTLVLTRTKGLQKQLMDDFEEIGMTDIRGRANYQCHIASHMNCEDGLHAGCLHGKGQSAATMLRNKCPYREAREAACAAKLVITNYAYWPLINWYGEGLGEFDLLVLDEAHEAPQAVCDLMGVTFGSREVDRMLVARFPKDADNSDIETWREWSKSMLPRASMMVEKTKQQVKDAQERGMAAPEFLLKEAAHWRALATKLTTVCASKGPWASEPTRISGMTGYRLEPLWPKEYAESALFRGIPRVLLVSATAHRKTLELLGLDEEQYVFREWPWIFPCNRSEITWLETVRVGQKMSAEDEQALLSRIDQLIGARSDRKGVVHSVSYRLRDKIVDSSVYADRMITHDQNSQSTAAAVERFKRSPAPAVLVSPSIATGYDFAYDLAEYQVIPKLPFPVVRGSRIMEARCDARRGGDPEYADHLMVQQFEQACGRIMRAPDDRGETIVLDDNFQWVKFQCRKQFASWFWRLYRRRTTAPNPPPKLQRNER